LGAELRLVVLQALLCLLALLTLTQLLELCFARLGNLAVYLATLGLRLSADHCGEGGDKNGGYLHRSPVYASLLRTLLRIAIGCDTMNLTEPK